MTALLALLAVATTPQPSELKTFTDWTVGCDNTLFCQAVALFPDFPSDDAIAEGASVVIVRDAGPTAQPVVTITLQNQVKGQIGFFIDGQRIDSAAANDGGMIEFRDARATKLLAAMANGRAFELRNAEDIPVARISLAGSSATLRYIDDRQKRVDTVTALVAKGVRPASAVPAPPPMPVIASPGGVLGKAFEPTRAEIARIRKESGCDAEEYQTPTEDVSAIDATHSVILLSCGAGAYNFSSVAYVAHVAGKRRVIEPARFDFDPGWGEEGGPPMLVNAGWAAETRSLSSYAKGRGLGDCGSSEEMAWDGARFRLIEARTMGECRGSLDWIRTWRATVKRGR